MRYFLGMLVLLVIIGFLLHVCGVSRQLQFGASSGRTLYIASDDQLIGSSGASNGHLYQGGTHIMGKFLQSINQQAAKVDTEPCD